MWGYQSKGTPKNVATKTRRHLNKMSKNKGALKYTGTKRSGHLDKEALK